MEKTGLGVVSWSPARIKNTRPLSNYDMIHAMDNVPKFKGVLCKDELPKNLKKGESLIINLDDSTGEGTHWVCLININNKLDYFDSYGLPPPEQVLKLNQTQSGLRYNSSQIQNRNTNICGHLCMLFIRERIKSTPMYDIIYSFEQI